MVEERPPRYWYSYVESGALGIGEDFTGLVIGEIRGGADVAEHIIKLHNDYVIQWHVERGTNPHLPPAPEGGKHIFGGTGYRCRRCGCYNRYQNNPPFYQECLGEWTESGKMRVAAEEKWLEDQRNYTHG